MRTRVFAALAAVALVMFFSGAAFADAPGQTQPDSTRHMMGFGMAFGIGIAAAGAAFGQGRAISAALESVSRQPEAGGRLQTMMLIGVVFIETLLIFTWVLLFIWTGKILG